MVQVRATSPPPIRFGIFELDLRTGELRRSGTKVRLDGQPFQVLALLLERAGELVSREELKGKLWPTSSPARSSNKAKTWKGCPSSLTFVPLRRSSPVRKSNSKIPNRIGGGDVART